MIAIRKYKYILIILFQSSLIVVVISSRRKLLLLLRIKFDMERVVVRSLHAFSPPMLQTILLQCRLLILLVVGILIQVLITCPLFNLLLLLLLLLLLRSLNHLFITVLLIQPRFCNTIWVLCRRSKILQFWVWFLVVTIDWSWVSATHYILEYLYTVHILLANDA